MPSLADLPVPAAPVEAAPAVAEAPPEAAPDVLPTPFDAIAAGKLPGLQVPPIQKEAGALDPIQDYVVSNLHVLQANGIEYTDLPNDTTVLYNPEVVTTDEIAKAHAAGTLDKLVPTSAAFQKFVAGQQAAAPEAGIAAVPGPAAPPAAGPAGSTPPGVNRARLQNVEPPSPIRPNPIPDRLARRTV